MSTPTAQSPALSPKGLLVAAVLVVLVGFLVTVVSFGGGFFVGIRSCEKVLGAETEKATAELNKLKHQLTELGYSGYDETTGEWVLKRPKFPRPVPGRPGSIGSTGETPIGSTGSN